MQNAKEKLSFAQAYLEWKRLKDWASPIYGPDEYLEEVILKEKAEIFDKIYDILTEERDEPDADVLDRIHSLVVNIE